MGLFKKRGFTLVELMVAVSILCIGIIFVLRSFIASASALDYTRNRLLAMQVLQEKIAELEQEAVEKGGTQPAEISEELQLGNRTADYKLEVTPLEEEELKEEINKAEMSLFWKENGRQKDEILVTYFPNKK